MEKYDRIIDIIEDHESIVQVLSSIGHSLDENKPLPQYVPSLHDSVVMDLLTKILERLNSGYQWTTTLSA